MFDDTEILDHTDGTMSVYVDGQLVLFHVTGDRTVLINKAKAIWERLSDDCSCLGWSEFSVVSASDEGDTAEVVLKYNLDDAVSDLTFHVRVKKNISITRMLASVLDIAYTKALEIQELQNELWHTPETELKSDTLMTKIEDLELDEPLVQLA